MSDFWGYGETNAGGFWKQTKTFWIVQFKSFPFLLAHPVVWFLYFVLYNGIFSELWLATRSFLTYFCWIMFDFNVIVPPYCILEVLSRVWYTYCRWILVLNFGKITDLFSNFLWSLYYPESLHIIYSYLSILIFPNLSICWIKSVQRPVWQ